MKATLRLLGAQVEEIQCGAIFGRGPIFGSTGVLADVELRGWGEGPPDEGAIDECKHPAVPDVRRENQSEL